MLALCPVNCRRDGKQPEQGSDGRRREGCGGRASGRRGSKNVHGPLVDGAVLDLQDSEIGHRAFLPDLQLDRGRRENPEKEVRGIAEFELALLAFREAILLDQEGLQGLEIGRARGQIVG